MKSFPLSAYRPVTADSESGEPSPPGRPGTTSRAAAVVRRPRHRLGVGAIAIVVVGSLVELGVVSFLAYLWSGRGLDPDGQSATFFWRYLALGGYAARTVTVCALIIRSAVDLQAVICTGLAAALLLEEHSVRLAEAATLSIMRAVNGGPASLSLLLARSPPRFFRSAPAFLTLVLLLDCVAIQFSSTLLLTDSRPVVIVADPQSAHTPVLETNSELLNPFQTTFQSDVGIWRQAVTSYPAFGEQMVSPPAADRPELSDTGLITRAFVPLPAQQRQTLHQYRGAAITHTSRVACTRPTIRGSIVDLAFTDDFHKDRVAGLIEGSLSWPSTAGIPGLEGLACGHNATAAAAAAGPGAACPEVPISCMLPYKGGDFAFPSILAQGPVALCLFHAPLGSNYPPGSPSHLYLVLSSNATAQDWVNGAGRNSSNATSIGQPSADAEWARYRFGENVTLSATVCLSNFTLDLENVFLDSVAGPRDQTLTYDAVAGWNVGDIASMVDSNRSAADVERGILSLSEASPVSKHEQDAMYGSSGPEYLPDVAVASELVQQFLGFIQGNVATPLETALDTPYNATAGNNSVYFCSLCAPGAQPYFDPHPATVLAFHGVLNSTSGRVAHAIHSTLFWLVQAQYYNAQPGFDFGSVATTTLAQVVQIPQAYTGLGIVTGLLALNMACVAALSTLFLLRTRHSIYGSAWHAVSQLAAPETRHVLERSTQATDGEVARSLARDGLGSALVGLYPLHSGRIVVARRTGAYNYSDYE